MGKGNRAEARRRAAGERTRLQARTPEQIVAAQQRRDVPPENAVCGPDPAPYLSEPYWADGIFDETGWSVDDDEPLN